MSWLFGIRKDTPGVPLDNFQLPVPPDSGAPNDGSGGDNKKRGKETTGMFDSTALERAAVAAKELERSS